MVRAVCSLESFECGTRDMVVVRMNDWCLPQLANEAKRERVNERVAKFRAPVQCG